MQTKIILAIVATAVVAVALIGVTFGLVSAQPQNITYSQSPSAPYGYYPTMYNNGTGIYIPFQQGTPQNGAVQGVYPYGYGFGMGRGMCGRYW